jgi:hypothetical protein
MGELLTWENLSNMNYTWEVALKTLRMFPLLFGGFRKAVKDTECGGYTIPEGWQVNSSVFTFYLFLFAITMNCYFSFYGFFLYSGLQT